MDHQKANPAESPAPRTAEECSASAPVSGFRPDPHQHWIELDENAYRQNLTSFRQLTAPRVKQMAVVKSNAYGHGAREMTSMAVKAGIDYLGVHCLNELKEINDLTGGIPVAMLGPLYTGNINEVIDLGLEPTLSDLSVATEFAAAAARKNQSIGINIKIETGTHRLGISSEEIPAWCSLLSENPLVQLRGIYTHFANIEDTTDHSFARNQLENLNTAAMLFTELGQQAPLIHSACSAAAIVMPETHLGLIRLGIAGYGLWPSRETYLSTLLPEEKGPALKPVLAWYTRIGQIKNLAAGEFVGYGCTFRATRPMRLAVLPVGYYDGYDRRLSGCGYVLVRGKRAPVIGRICMNMMMIDITDIPGVCLADQVTLVGSDGNETISVDLLASLCKTINYEITSRLGRHIPRLIISA